MKEDLPMNLTNRWNNDRSFRHQVLFITALLAVLIYASFIFGARVYLVALVAIVVSAVVEYVFHHYRKSPFGLGVLITPLLLTLLLPPTIPLWMACVGSFFGTFFAKSLFGGDGSYIFNPAVAGILFLIITFPAEMNTMWLNPVTGAIQTFTPVNSLPFDPIPLDFTDQLFGMTAGAIGETARLFLLGLGVLLMVLRVIDYKMTLGFLVSFFVLQLVFHWIAGPFNPLFSLFTGTTVFASVFLVPDPTVAPKHWGARLVYVSGVALITIIIRMFAAFPEGIIFALIIMAAISPLLDSMFEPKEETV
jgi:Na+-translocating ferredoxin:NAD+ oxidoreductase RnfD subunit